jgi:hypothetical protein
MPDLATLHRIAEACGTDLRLGLAERDAQREANEAAALERTVEQRLLANQAHVELIGALRDG